MEKFVDNDKIKKTAYSWSKIYGIKFTNIEPGFSSENFFNKVYITALDFLEKASLCEVEKQEGASRRDANRLKRKVIPR
jgi:hypothetical protein